MSTGVLVSITIARMKHCDQKQVEEERIYLVSMPTFAVYHYDVRVEMHTEQEPGSGADAETMAGY